LLHELVLEVKKRCKDNDEATRNSGLYRLFLTYSFRNKELEKEDGKNPQKSAYELARDQNLWRNKIIEAKIVNEKKSYEEALDEMNMEEEKKKNTEMLKEEEKRLLKGTFYDFLKCLVNENKEISGFHNKQDIQNSKNIIESDFRPYRFKKALVFGIKMESRGMECSEDENSINTLNVLNDLKLNWDDKKGVSCWFKYRYNSKSFDDTKFGCVDNLKLTELQQKTTGLITSFLKDDFCFGQFNYFFRISIPTETLLNGLPMASAVCRKSTISDCYLQTVDILTSLNSSYLPHKRFVTLSNVYSTKILIGGRDSLKLPIQLTVNYDDSQHTTTRRIFSKCQPNEVADLYLLDMHPQRESVKYDNMNSSYYRFEFSHKQNY
jgi:hypothetical protein